MSTAPFATASGLDVTPRGAHTTFSLPLGRSATEPPEHRGLARDGVRLLVAEPSAVRHARFADLPQFLAPGDLVVVNTSATLPAALTGVITGPSSHAADVHVAAELPDGTWVVEVRLPSGDGPNMSLAPGRVIELPGDLRVVLTDSFPEPGRRGSRLWRVRRADTLTGNPSDPSDACSEDRDALSSDYPRQSVPMPGRIAYLRAHGRPIAYGYVREHFPLSDYQTVYATEPGSAELVSAGRPFTERLLVRLLAAGVTVTPLILHTGVSSPEAHEPPAPEPYAVGADTARLVNSARRAGRRVVAVGTTVVRALESVAGPNGCVRAGAGWTDLVLHAGRPARVVDGLITGFHEPEASHLMLLESVAGPALVEAAYRAAVAGTSPAYLWHEFGDSMLLLPGGSA